MEVAMGGGFGDAAPQQSDALWSTIIDDLSIHSEGLDATLQRLAERASHTLHSAASVFLVTREGMLEPRAFWDDDPGRLAGIRELFGRGMVGAGVGQLGEVVRSREPLVVPLAVDVPHGPGEMPYEGYIGTSGLNSYLIVPMVAEDQVVGLIAVGRHGDQPPIDDEVKHVAERLAVVAAQVVRLATLVDRRRLADVALNAMRDAVIAVDRQGLITFWNTGAEHLYGYPADEATGRRVSDFLSSAVHGSPGEVFEAARVDAEIDRQGAWMGRVDQTRRDGATIVVDSLVSPLRNAGGHRLGAVIVNRDVTDVVAIGTALRRQELLAQAALDSSPMLTAVVDSAGVIVAASRGWSDRIGADLGIGSRLGDVVEDLIPDPADRTELLASFEAVAGDDVTRTQGDYEVHTQEADRTFSVHVTRVPDVGAAITIADITDRVSRERELSYSATHDLVTRLLNRSVLIDRAIHAINRAARHGAMVGLLFCDLDGFKALNDRYGHGTGDDILEFFGARLVESCRSSDTVARIGGDEFAILIEDAVEDDTVPSVAKRVVVAAGSPLTVPAGDISLSTSIGAVVTRPEPEKSYGEADVDLLLRHADAAMYEAKRRGKNRWVMFDDAIQAREESRGALVGDLVRGTRSGEFLLHFQPQFDASDGLCGAEALLRWHHPVQGLIEPFEVLQQPGTIPLAIGDWVLGQVSATAAEWAPMLPPSFRLGVNLSRSQWLDRNTPDVLMDWLARLHVPPTQLRVELPQDALADDLDYSAAVTRRLSETGIEVALNGFGTGAAQLVDLGRMSLGTVVLGRKVVRDIGRRPGAEALLRGIVAMSRQMGWRVIATGVESPEQLQAVRGVGCQVAQGFLLGRPVPGSEFVAEYLHPAPAGHSLT